MDEMSLRVDEAISFFKEQIATLEERSASSPLCLDTAVVE
jgi:hypothetical protein